ncbi:hypothetical protein [Nostoc sp. WHI]|uniref:hypothetical protein n=1 Tax=Nostoc sp. WHI TaxID=2650611 RepID=UPI0018C64BDC|nr:hypothetical protein [Nostoc sp. WHI]MBG1267341.1 hypothetical protein [Nostoc sp. WHI]
MDYRHFFISLLERLQSNSYIDVQHQWIGESTDSFLLDVTLASLNFKIPEKLLEFYRNVDGLKIIWTCDLEQHGTLDKYNKDDSNFSGRLEILPFQDMVKFDPKMKSRVWTQFLDEEEREELNKFRYFDYNDDNIRVGFIFDNESSEEDMVFIEQESEGFCPVNLSFDDYIRVMLSTKGFQGWQHTLFYKESSTNFVEKMKFYLKQLFPDDAIEGF